MYLMLVGIFYGFKRYFNEIKLNIYVFGNDF